MISRTCCRRLISSTQCNLYSKRLFASKPSQDDPLFQPHSPPPPSPSLDTTTNSKQRQQQSQRVWKANNNNVSHAWSHRAIDSADIEAQINKIEQQETTGGRMKARQLGVLNEDPVLDMQLLTHNYTVPALASALRDREDALQQAAVLAENEDWQQLQQFLKIFHPSLVLTRRLDRRRANLTLNWDSHAVERLRKALMRMPRTVVSAHASRAGVVIPLCLVNNTPSLLLEKRALHLRAHPDEVCLPGGMVCEISDPNIVATCLREMKEEIRGLESNNDNIQVLGVLRCQWGEVHHLVGVAVTPVVCFLGELPDNLQPNPDEVSEIFTIPLSSLWEKSYWRHKEGLAPIFLGAPHICWGLTGYILYQFWKNILLPNASVAASDNEDIVP